MLQWFILISFAAASASINFGPGEEGKQKCRQFKIENSTNVIIKSECFEAKEVKVTGRN